jgi:hypothetical protein
MDPEFALLYKEVLLLRRDIEEIKEMMIPEVSPSKQERKVIEKGREELTRGEVEEWSEVRKEILK